MESITNPLLKQLEATNGQYKIAVDALIEGNPTYMTEIHKLCDEMNKLIGLVKQVMAHIQSNMESENKTIASYKEAITTAVSSAVYGTHGFSLPSVNLPAKSILETSILPFILSEINNIIKIVSEVQKLLGNITNLAPVVSFLISEVNKLKGTLSADLIKFENRLKIELDKVNKNAEWVETELGITFDEMMSTYRINLYTDEYYNQTNKKVKDFLQTQIDSEKRVLSVSIPSRRKALQEDKEYWEERWKKELEKNA